jgi:hypothetical protein
VLVRIDADQSGIVWLVFMLAGAVATVLGVFMWQGGWAALAAFGLLAALVAMSQAIVVATSAGAKEMLAAISAIKNQAG